jgi:ketosteroid isomerase-like protein
MRFQPKPKRQAPSIWKVLSILLILSAPPFDCRAQEKSGSEENRVIALENAWNQAVHAKDAIALKMLLAPDIVYVDYDGKLMGKQQYLASIQSPTLQPTRIVSESMNVHIYGGVALVHGVYRETGIRNGKPYTLRERFTDAWTKGRDGAWICISSHSTLIEHP